MAQGSRKKSKDAGTEPAVSRDELPEPAQYDPVLRDPIVTLQPLPPPLPSPIGTSADYDSGWVHDQKQQTNWSVAVNHNLGVLPSLLTLWFSPDGGLRAYPVQWPWSSTESGNPVTIEITDQQIILHEHFGTHLHGTWSPATDWKFYDEGYWRIFAWR